MSSASVLAPTVVMSCFNSEAINAHSLSLKLYSSRRTKDQLKQLEADLCGAADNLRANSEESLRKRRPKKRKPIALLIVRESIEVLN